MTAAASRGAPLEAYGRLPSMEHVSISPDGTRIAYIRAVGQDRHIEIRSLADQEVLAHFTVAEEKVRGLEMADDNHVLLITSATKVPNGLVGAKGEWFRLIVYNIDKKQWVELPDWSKIVDREGIFRRIDPMSAISGRVVVRRVNGHTVLFFHSYYVLVRPVPALMQADLDSGEEKLLRVAPVDNAGGSLGWAVDAQGEVIVEQNYYERDQRWSVAARRKGVWEEIASGKASIEFPRLIGFGTTSDALLVQAGEDGAWIWELMALKDGSLTPPLEGISMERPMEDRFTGRWVGGSHLEDRDRYTFFDPGTQSRWKALVESFEGGHVQFVSASADFKKIVVLVEGTKVGYRYELIDVGASHAEQIGNVYEEIAEPLEVRRIDYPAADGLAIPAYLTLPRGNAGKNLPLVVLVHGGPAARDTADFDWWSQALADRGYAVLRPNYRGSTVSRQHLAAGFGEYGRKMQSDLSDGVRYLVREGIADPARVCIVGGSYGGYAALAGVTLESGVYRCAVSVAGLSDLRGFLKWVNEKHADRSSRGQRYLDRFMGVTGPNDPALERISPIKHVQSVTVPILLIHGKDDTVVPYDQSEDMYDALRHAKKVVELVTLTREDHWLSREETRLQMLRATIDFLQRNNPPFVY